MTAFLSFINFLLDIPHALDVFIILFIVASMARGAVRGFWRALWRFIFVVVVLDFSYLALLSPLAEFINYGFWSSTGATINISLGGTSYHLSSIDDLIRSIVAYSSAMGYVSAGSKLLDAYYVGGFSMALCRAIGWGVLVVFTHLAGWIFSSLLYVFPIRHMVSPQTRESKLRPLGALFGGMTGMVFAICFGIVLSPFHYGLAALTNPDSYPYQVSATMIKAGDVLDPNASFMIGWVGFDDKPGGFMPNIFSFSVSEGNTETTYYLDEEISYFISETQAH